MKWSGLYCLLPDSSRVWSRDGAAAAAALPSQASETGGAAGMGGTRLTGSLLVKETEHGRAGLVGTFLNLGSWSKPLSDYEFKMVKMLNILPAHKGALQTRDVPPKSAINAYYY